MAGFRACRALGGRRAWRPAPRARVDEGWSGDNEPTAILADAPAVTMRRFTASPSGPAMTLLILGLALFLGVHSVRIVAEGWRGRTLARVGEGPWKGGYSLLSLAGLALVVWGWGLARQQPVQLWVPPVWTRHLAGLLMLAAFILLVAAYVPRNAIRARLRHPMVLGVKTWALAHLLANGSLAAVLLFGSFLLWAVLDFRAARQRDRAVGAVPPLATSGAATGLTVVVGALAWGVFAFWGHAWLIGVRPFG